MNTTDARHTATTLATAATVLAATLTVTTVLAPTAAGADRADPYRGTATHSAGSGGYIDIAAVVDKRKVATAQYYVDHARELHREAR